jgi:hypothetical protein
MTEISAVGNDVSLTAVSLTITNEISYEKWEQVVNQLMITEAAAPWWLGDLLRYGEHRYGEKYAQAVEMTGRSVATLTNWVWVANQYPPSKRRENLSWSIHRELAPLEPDERERWLDAAESEQWSKAELRQQIRMTPSGDSPHVTRPPRALPTGDNGSSIQNVEVETSDRICWVVKVTTPVTSDLDTVDSRIRRSAESLEAVLVALKQDPEINVYIATDE